MKQKFVDRSVNPVNMEHMKNAIDAIFKKYRNIFAVIAKMIWNLLYSWHKIPSLITLESSTDQ